MNKIEEIHIGSIIREKINESSISITEFADRIERDRTTIYNIFKRKSIDVDLLISISRALDYNFLHEIYCSHYTGKKSKARSCRSKYN